MSASADLKERIAAVVESHRDDIVEVGETIMRNPELGLQGIRDRGVGPAQVR